MVGWAELPRSPGHAFYDRLQAILIEAGFDGFAERQCARPLRRQAGPAVAAAGPLLPDASGRLLRGDRQRARPGMALRRQPVAARVPAAGHDRAGARPFLAYVDGHGKQSRSWLYPSVVQRKPSEPKVCARRLRASFGCASAEAKAGSVQAIPTATRNSLVYRRASPVGVAGRSGQVRPYVRPVARPTPLATMGVRSRARHQSEQRARGAAKNTVSPGLSRPQPFPSRRSALPAGSAGLASAAFRAPERHATASAAAATRPFAR